MPKQTATGTTKTLPKQYNKIPPITQTTISNPPKCPYCNINSLKNDKGLNIHFGIMHPEQKIRKI